MLSEFHLPNASHLATGESSRGCPALRSSSGERDGLGWAVAGTLFSLSVWYRGRPGMFTSETPCTWCRCGKVQGSSPTGELGGCGDRGSSLKESSIGRLALALLCSSHLPSGWLDPEIETFPYSLCFTWTCTWGREALTRLYRSHRTHCVHTCNDFSRLQPYQQSTITWTTDFCIALDSNFSYYKHSTWTFNW